MGEGYEALATKEPRRSWKGVRLRDGAQHPHPTSAKPLRGQAYVSLPIKGEEERADSVYRDVLYMYLNGVTLSIENNQIGYALDEGLPLAAAQHRR